MIVRLAVKQKIELLEILLDIFCCDASISFEGDLSQADTRGISGISHEPSGVLVRNTTWPQQDFLIIPITDSTIDLIKQHILPRIGIGTRVNHIQIEKNGELVFGAYDNFYEGCVWIKLDVERSFFDSLVESKILRRYEVLPDSPVSS